VAVMRASSVLNVVAVGLAHVASEDELSFSTAGREVYRGELIDAAFLVRAPDTAPHLLVPGTSMELELHMRDLDTEPGHVRTSDGLLDTPLVALPEITRDRLSALEIPGGFLRSLVLMAPTSAPELEGVDATLFISLGQDDDVEVRVLAGAGERRRAFGVFRLSREVQEEGG
jgi:hypothetical protein